MKKIRMNCTATLDETFADFLLSRRAKGLAEKTLESYSSQWKAVTRHLDTGTDIAALQKADLDAMIVSMRDAGLSPNSTVFGILRFLLLYWNGREGNPLPPIMLYYLPRLSIFSFKPSIASNISDASTVAEMRESTFPQHRLQAVPAPAQIIAVL